MFCNTRNLSLGPAATQSATPRALQNSQRRGGPVSVVANRTGNDAALDPDAAILLNTMRRRAGPRATSSTFGYTRSGTDAESDADFITKLKAAWRIFFPEKQRSLSPKEEGKKRLRMILVADRMGLGNMAIQAMKDGILKAVEPYIEVESDEAVEVNLSMDPEIGTIYSVAVPVRRVKPVMRPSMLDDSSVIATWDPTDPESSPADQFPYGT